MSRHHSTSNHRHHARGYRAFSLAALLAALVAGCGEFQVASIVLDLRILGIDVEPPEAIVAFDEQQGIDLGSIPDMSVCALVSDPADSRLLSYRMALCAPTESKLCDDPERVVIELGAGTVPDPEESETPATLCATVTPAAALAVIADLIETLESEDELAAIIVADGGNLELQLEFSVRGEEQRQEDAQYATKRLRYGVPLPPERVANKNPVMDDLHGSVENGTEPVSMPAGRCRDVTPLVVAPGATINFEPVEQPGAREDYLVPTFEGGSRMFTENLSYSWYATHGDWERERTGGNKDVAGNAPPLDSEWRAPEDAAVIGDGLDVSIWVVQRDERGGSSWRQTCVRVQP